MKLKYNENVFLNIETWNNEQIHKHLTQINIKCNVPCFYKGILYDTVNKIKLAIISASKSAKYISELEQCSIALDLKCLIIITGDD